MKTKIIAIASALTLAGCTSQHTTENDSNTPTHEVEMTGAYSTERDPSAEELALFAAIYKGEPKLTPFKVSSQVVAGMNYAFTCKDKEGNTYRVVIYQPLPRQGDAKVTSVERK